MTGFKLQKKKTSLKAIKPIFLFHWLTLPLFLFYTNLAVILHGVYAKPKCLILRASTVKAAHEQFSEQGGVSIKPCFCKEAVTLHSVEGALRF